MIYPILTTFSFLVLFPNCLVSSFSYDSTVISWSGYDWRIKEGLRQPGPNHFTEDAVQLTNDNKTLSLVFEPLADGNWSTAEIYSIASLGYGTYSWVISSETATFPAQVVFGMFTWEDSSDDPNSREIDIEFAKWSNASDPRNIQFTVQPHSVPGNAQRYKIDPSQGQTKAEFTWSPCGVSFRTYKYDSVNGSGQFVHHTDTINRVLSGNEKVHINFWLWQTEALERSIQVDIESFTFTPLVDTDPQLIVGNESIIYPLFPFITSHVHEFNSKLARELVSYLDIVQKFILDRLCAA